MNFTKTSPKFGQWSDHRANTVYGLGFSSEGDLLQVKSICSMAMMGDTGTVVLQFVDKFCEAKEAAKKALEERKFEGKKTEDSDKITSSSPELKSPHQVTLTNPSGTSPQVDGRKGEEGARQLPMGGIANGESSGGRKTAYANSTEVKHIE